MFEELSRAEPGQYLDGRPEKTCGAFPLHGTARFTFGKVFHWVKYLVPGTSFSTTSAEVPSDPYHHQNVKCKLC